MIRMLGVLCGAGIAIVLLTWLVGVPQFTSERETAEPSLAVVPLRDVVTADVAVAEMPLAESASSPSPDTALPVDPQPEPEALASETLPGIAAPVEEPEPEPFVPAEGLPDLQWFAFWTPFRSEIAANGFVGRLQSVTGLDYRVVKVKPGVYEVAFAYLEDAEIDSNLSTISAATGLDLPGAP